MAKPKSDLWYASQTFPVTTSESYSETSCSHEVTRRHPEKGEGIV